MKKLEIKSWWDGDTTIYSLETENGDVIGRYWSFEDANEAKAKEEMSMKNANGQAQVIDFEMDGIRYTMTRVGYYYKKENGKQVRIGKAEWDAAWEQSGEAEKQEREAEAAKSDKEAEKAMKKIAKKPRKSKDIAFEGNGVTLTEKQVKFIKRVPDDDFYENGLDSTLWIDVLCDTIADEFNSMSVGAMVSTLREKGVIYVDKQKVNGKWSKYFGFTEIGQKIVKELGLN